MITGIGSNSMWRNHKITRPLNKVTCDLYHLPQIWLISPVSCHLPHIWVQTIQLITDGMISCKNFSSLIALFCSRLSSISNIYWKTRGWENMAGSLVQSWLAGLMSSSKSFAHYSSFKFKVANFIVLNRSRGRCWCSPLDNSPCFR